jgi:NitT/TauT family transport system permease protein
MAVDAEQLSIELAGLDALELGSTSKTSRLRRSWRVLWPKAAAVGIALAVWQVVVWSHWKPSYVLPGPRPVLSALWHDGRTVVFWRSIGTTMRRAVTGYAIAVVLGLVVGGLVARSQILRAALGSFITGLQTMPSVTWVPLALILFKLGDGAIVFVVVIGAAPSIANGFVSGIDHVPPLLLRSGRMLGARGIGLWRHVIVPAALPSLVSGLKQGWAFAWRSLMAGEIIALVGHRVSIGQQLEQAQTVNNSAGLLEWMVVVLVLGIAVDAVFGVADRSLRRKWGLTATPE